MKINEGVIKQLVAGFLEVTLYPKWLANIVPTPKKSKNVCQL